MRPRFVTKRTGEINIRWRIRISIAEAMVTISAIALGIAKITITYRRHTMRHLSRAADNSRLPRPK